MSSSSSYLQNNDRDYGKFIHDGDRLCLDHHGHVLFDLIQLVA